MTTQPFQPYDRSLGRPTINVGFYVYARNSLEYTSTAGLYYIWGWVRDAKIFLIPDEIATNNHHYDATVNSDGNLVLTLKAKQDTDILNTMFGTSYNNRHVWRNNCAQWKVINPNVPPSEMFEAFHHCCLFEGQEAAVKGLDTLQSRQVFAELGTHQPNIERLGKLIANHLHPYDSTNDTYGIHEHLTEVNDATHYFNEIRTGLLAANKTGYHLGLSDDEFLDTYVVSKLPSIRFSFASTNNQANTPVTVTITKERLTGGDIKWQKLVSTDWTGLM